MKLLRSYSHRARQLARKHCKFLFCIFFALFVLQQLNLSPLSHVALINFENFGKVSRETIHKSESSGDIESLSEFLKMSLFVIEGLPKYSSIPGLESLTFYLWEVDPKPIIMLENSHLKWYESKSEKQVIGLMRYLLSKKYSSGDGIVVDMGINDGYIAALAAAYDYDVVGVDGQPECVRRFMLAKAMNNWRNVRVYNNIISDDYISMKVPNGVCGGGSRYLEGDKNVPRIILNRGISVAIPGETAVKSKKLDELVPFEDILFFHLDVEGAELSVLKSATRALRERRVKNLVWEFAPHRWMKERSKSILEVQSLMSGFICRNTMDIKINDPFKSGGIITNWVNYYVDTEARRAILDIWCFLR